MVRNSELRAVPIFAALGEDVLAEIAECGHEHHYPRDHVLVEQGGPADYLHILVAGQVGLTAKASDGRTTVVEVLRAIDLFFIAAVLSDAPALMGVVTLDPCRIFRIPAEHFRRLTDEHPRLARAMLHVVGQQFRLLACQVKDLKLRTSTQRLGCYLLALARENGADGEFRLPYDKRLLAGRLGMTPENLSRAFASLREYGVETHGSRVALHDQAALEAFADPDLLR